jgi:hypothetical protein
MLPFQSLDAATATGPGEALDLGSDPADHFAVQIGIDGTPTSSSETWQANYTLEGSLDGESWFSVKPVVSVTLPADTYAAGAGSISGSSTTEASFAAQWAAFGNYATTPQGSADLSPLARFVRVNLTGANNASSFTASAWIVPGQAT